MDRKEKNKKRKNSIRAIYDVGLSDKSNIRYLKGSYTIEASVIVPLIFVLLVAMIFLALYFRDIVYIKSLAYKTVFEYEEEATAGEILEEKLKNGLMTITLEKAVLTRSEDEASVHIVCGYSIPFKYIKSFLENTKGKIVVDISEKNLNGRNNILINQLWK